jgi:hypothetical protein
VGGLLDERSGQGEIYVRRFDPMGTVDDPPEWTVSNGARSVRPLWRGDEILYRTREQQVVASVRVKTGIDAGPQFSAGVPELLFPLTAPILPWELSKDGQRFIFPLPATEAQATAYKIVLNWEAMLER